MVDTMAVMDQVGDTTQDIMDGDIITITTQVMDGVVDTTEVDTMVADLIVEVTEIIQDYMVVPMKTLLVEVEPMGLAQVVFVKEVVLAHVVIIIVVEEFQVEEITQLILVRPLRAQIVAQTHLLDVV